MGSYVCLNLTYAKGINSHNGIAHPRAVGLEKFSIVYVPTGL